MQAERIQEKRAWRNISADQIVQEDLDLICNGLQEEFGQMAGKKLLIVGGAGFLGYYMVQAILHWNKRVAAEQTPDRAIALTVYDNYIRGVPDWLISRASELTLVKHDITNPLPESIDDFQYIVHAASIASPIFYRKYPIETMDANVNGLRFLLDYCKAQQEKVDKVEGFLFYSTSEIYGDPTPENIPTPETYRGNVSSIGPRACYDESKRYGETLCVNFAQQYDLPIKIVRPFNNYGPGLKITDRRALPDFARDIFAGNDIVMLSDGSPTRTFCYITDAVIGYYKVLIRGRVGQAYNIGTDQPEISIATLADTVTEISRELFDYGGKVVRQTSPDRDYLIDNPNRRCPIITKARDELDYHPSIMLDEGLRRSLIWYSGNLEAEDA